MDKITVKQIYQIIGVVFAVMTAAFTYIAYYAVDRGYDVAGVYFMIICAAGITLGLSVTMFVVASKTDR